MDELGFADFVKLFDAVHFHCVEYPPVHDAPDGSLCIQKGWDRTTGSVLHGDLWLRRRGEWVRLGGAADVLTVPTVAAVRIAGHTGFHPTIINQTHGGGPGGLTPRYDDGGARLFQWDPTDATSADNGGTILRTSTDGSPGTLEDRCFKVNTSGGVPVTWFGAYPKSRAVPGGNAGDANITAGTAVLTCTNILFTAADEGKTVSVPKAKFNQLPGTVQTFSGSKGVRSTGINFLDQIWVGEPVTIGGVDYTVDEIASGTVAVSTSNLNLVGTGTHFTTELWIGAEVAVYGATLEAAQKFTVAAITNDTLAVLNALPHGTASGCSLRVVAGPEVVASGTVAVSTSNTDLIGTGTHFLSELILTIFPLLVFINGSRYLVTAVTDDTHATLSTVGASTISGQTMYIAPGINTTYHHFLISAAAGSSASGLTVRGHRGTLITTITSVAAGVATLAATADYTVVDGFAAVGTPDDAAFNAAKAVGDLVIVPAPQTDTPLAGDTVPVGPGAYFLVNEFILDRKRQRLEIQKNARILQAQPLTVDAVEVDLFGHALAYTFDADGPRQFTNIWIGQPGKEIVRVSNTVGISASGSPLRGLSIAQMIDLGATATYVGEWGGHGGMTGIRLGLSAGAAGGGGFGDIAVSDCRVGVNIQATIQQTHFEKFRIVRSDGYSHFSPDPGIMNGADGHFNGANTASQIERGTIQGHRTGIQVGSTQYANGADTQVIGPGMITIESMPSFFPCTVMHCKGSDVSISNFHFEYENAATSLMGTWQAIQLGSPVSIPGSTATQSVRLWDNRLSGMNTIVALYCCDGGEIAGNYFDTSGATSAAHPPYFVRNFRGGTRQQYIRYFANTKPGAGFNALGPEIDRLDGTGPSGYAFSYVEASNVIGDGSGQNPRIEAPARLHVNVIDGNRWDGTDHTVITNHIEWNAAIVTGIESTWRYATPDGNQPTWVISNGVSHLIDNKYPATVSATSNTTLLQLNQNYWNGTTNVLAAVLFLPWFSGGLGTTTPQMEMDLNLGSAAFSFYWDARATGGNQSSFSIGTVGPTQFPARIYESDSGVPTTALLGHDAQIGSICLRRDGGLGSMLYGKTGAGNANWVPFAQGGPFVPLSATVQGTAPIQIAGDNAAHDLSVPRTWSITTVSNTTAGTATAITAANTLFSSPSGTTGTWNTLATLGIVPYGRTLTTTTPLRIDGGASADLSANRTLSILPSVTNGDVLTTVGGVVVWQAPAGGFVPTSRLLISSGPITIDGVSGGSGDLSADRTIGVLSATTSGLGVIQLADDLDGTATAPDVIAATGLSGTFTVRCTNLTFASSGTIVNSSGSLAVTAAVGDLALSAAGTLTAAAGAGTFTLGAGGANVTTSGIGGISLDSANNVFVSCTTGNVFGVSINSTASFQVHEGKISLNNHTLNGSSFFDPTDAVKITINGSDYWVDVRLV